ncbi:MAG: hypothetical protein Q7K57_06215 [Burkholderiaceae bacterium]|nr:hypothetical protein [Burkholderiaceae bacterium]
MNKLDVATISSGNIGINQTIKIMRHGKTWKSGAMVSIDPASDGLARAVVMGIVTTSDEVGTLINSLFSVIDILFDAIAMSAGCEFLLHRRKA